MHIYLCNLPKYLYFTPWQHKKDGEQLDPISEKDGSLQKQGAKINDVKH